MPYFPEPPVQPSKEYIKASMINNYAESIVPHLAAVHYSYRNPVLDNELAKTIVKEAYRVAEEMYKQRKKD